MSKSHLTSVICLPDNKTVKSLSKATYYCSRSPGKKPVTRKDSRERELSDGSWRTVYPASKTGSPD
jgi:hypothetical protein